MGDERDVEKERTLHRMKYKPATNPVLQERLVDKLNDGGNPWHGHYASVVCVFHQSFPVRPSLFIYPDWFVCKSCGIEGPLEKLEQLLSGVKTPYKSDEDVIVNELPQFKKYRTEYGGYRSAVAFAYLTGQEYPILMKYLQSRKLGDVIRKAKIGYIEGWLSFPVYDSDGIFVDWVLRATPAIQTTSKYVCRPRRNKTEGFSLYSIDWKRINDAKAIYIPFGLLDMLTLDLCGLATATGLTGKTYQALWFDQIRKKIYLIPDAGEEDAAHKLKRQLGWRASVLLLDYPNECKDVNDILMKYDVPKVLDIINRSVHE